MRYFEFSEFDSPDQEGTGLLMDQTFLQMLDNARDIARIPFRITSGYRTKERNKQVGGVEDSAHTKGLAADIFYHNEKEKYLIFSALVQAGFRRIGVASNFIHVDNDHTKPYPAYWVY